MNIAIILAAAAFAVGLIWGMRTPAGYCSMSRKEQRGFANRLLSGTINGVILGGIVGVVATIVTG